MHASLLAIWYNFCGGPYMHPDRSILSEEDSGVHAGAVGELVQRQADVPILYQHRLTCMLRNHISAEIISSTPHD